MIRSNLSNAAWCLMAGSLLAGFQQSCAQEPANAPASAARVDSTTLEPPYTLAEPDTVFQLPIDLLEISGLTLLDDNHLGAIQDEDGDLYVIEAASGRVVRHERFEKEGDYEGVERINDGRIVVLRSDGALFAIEDWTDGTYSNSEVTRQETNIHNKCDAEGLGYDVQTNRLLIACKDFAGKGLDGRKAIYAYNMGSEKLLREPAYVISTDDFEQTYPDNPLDNKLREFLEPAWDLSGFTPSALAIHPVTSHLYILSSTRKALIILDPDGTLLNVWILPDEIFEQPEGLTFLPNGDLFISSEGRNDHAVLARYTFRQP